MKVITALVGVFSLFTTAANAELINVQFKSQVTHSDVPTISIGEQVTIELTYDTTAPFDGGSFYHDSNVESGIKATFSGGLVIQTDPNYIGTTRLDMYTFNHEPTPGQFSYDTNYHSNYSNVSSNGMLVYSLDLAFSEQTNVNNGNTLRTEWVTDLAAYTFTDFSMSTDQGVVHSTITEIVASSVSPIEVNATTYSDPISALGGRLYFIRDVKNSSDNVIEIKRYEYIVFPDGSIENGV